MILSHVPLEMVDDNPYQPRRDYPTIAEFAAQILTAKDAYPDTAGLIHIPMGRVVDETGAMIPGESPEGAHRVQIAAGHRRFRAFQHLAQTDPDYSLFPVILADLDDGDMAKTAWRENEERTDLTPMDEARSFEFMSQSLGWRHAEIAEALGVSRSAVSNKLRLLQFPEWVQDKVHDLSLPERTARNAMPLLQIPELLKPGIFTHPDGTTRTSRDTTVTVEAALERVSENLADVTWDPLDMWTPQYDDSYPVKINGKTVVIDRDTRACGNCPHRHKISGKERCLDPLCFAAKIGAWKAEVVGPAKAKKLYSRFSAWKQSAIDVNEWATCTACDLKARELDNRSGWYHPISQSWTHVCPWCWSRAGLPKDPPQEAPKPAAGAGTVVKGAPTGQDMSPLPAGTSSLAAPQAPQPPAAPPRPAPVLEPITQPSHRFQATVMTIRIEPGDDDQRAITVSMGDETSPGRIDLNSIQMKTGIVDEITHIVDDMMAEYFPDH